LWAAIHGWATFGRSLPATVVLTNATGAIPGRRSGTLSAAPVRARALDPEATTLA
jgi:hypothetical protein